MPRPRRPWTRWILAGGGGAAVLGAALLTTLYRLEQRDPFCVACHLHQEKYDRFTRARGRVEDLAGAHGAKGVRCIGCHGGADAPTRARIWAVAARDTAKYIVGGVREPDHMDLPLRDADCRWCHQELESLDWQMKADRPFHGPTHAGLPAKTPCVGCHPAHPPGNAARRFLHAGAALPACFQCHPPGPRLRALPLFADP